MDFDLAIAHEEKNIRNDKAFLNLHFNGKLF